MVNVNKFVVSLLAASLLAACGKKDEPQVDPVSMRRPSAGDVRVFQPAPESAAPGLPTVQVDSARAYQEVESGVDLAYIYYALTDLPVDYESLAAEVSEDYRRTTDTFKKKEILDVLRPEIQAKIAALKAHPFVKVRVDSSSLGHYDMASQSFPVQGLPLDKGQYLSFNKGGSYRLSITNGADFRQLKVADETRARAMEAIVSAKASFSTPAEMYLYAQAADKNTHVVQFQLVQVKLKDEKGALVAEIQ